MPLIPRTRLHKRRNPSHVLILIPHHPDIFKQCLCKPRHTFLELELQHIVHTLAARCDRHEIAAPFVYPRIRQRQCGAIVVFVQEDRDAAMEVA